MCLCLYTNTFVPLLSILVIESGVGSHETGREATLKHSRRTTYVCKGQFKLREGIESSALYSSEEHLYTGGGGGDDGDSSSLLKESVDLAPFHRQRD